jgi:predicted DCC family thiol-disulfide oxidoreductase YuxK
VPDELPAPIVLFDGDCGMCSGFVRFVLRASDDDSILFVALQSNRGQELLRFHGIDPAVTDSIVVIIKGHAWTYSSAIVEISRYLRFPWSILGSIALIPRPLRDFGYRIIARFRRRVTPVRSHCRIMKPNESARIHLG